MKLGGGGGCRRNQTELDILLLTYLYVELVPVHNLRITAVLSMSGFQSLEYM